jgi:hypothetical protein
MRNACGASHYISARRMEGIVTEALHEDARTGAFRYEPRGGPRKMDEEEALRVALKRMPARLQRVNEAYEDGFYSLAQAKAARAAIGAEREALAKKLQRQTEGTDRAKEAAAIQKRIALALKSMGADAPPAVRQKHARAVISRIVFSRSSATVTVVYG